MKETIYITEPEKRVPVLGSYDVVVVGGGIAGVAAAGAAARNGAKVCLIEKENALGGLATLGLVVIYLPLCDGMGHQLIKGIGEELLKLSVQDGSAEIPAAWKEEGQQTARLQQRYRVEYNPASYIMALENWSLENGVELLYDTRFCDVLKEGELIRAILVENKSGRSAIRCTTVIDASGDADVCARAGEKTISLSTNVTAGWFYAYDDSQVSLHKLSRPFDPYAQNIPDDGRGFSGNNGAEVTAFNIAARQYIQEELDKLRKKRGSASIYPFLLPTIPGFRMTRRLQGRFELEEGDERRYFEDTIGMMGDWRQRGPVYYLPFRALQAVNTDNLLTAGRCISAGTAWDITRVIPVCAVTGEAVGTAAALACSHTGGSFSALDHRLLHDQLLSQRVCIDPSFADSGD